MMMMLILLQGCALPWPPENCIEMWKAEKAQVLTIHCDDHDSTYDDYYAEKCDDYHAEKYDGSHHLYTTRSLGPFYLAALWAC